MHNPIRRVFRNPKHTVAAAGVLLISAAAGCLVVITQAATYGANAEAESGTLSTEAKVQAGTGASGGSAVRFGSATTPPPGTPPPSPPGNCTNPVFNTSDSNGGWSNGGYYVHNNMWNTAEAGPETLYACSYKSWYVTSTQPNTTSVKTYPNVHLDVNNMNGEPMSKYSTINTTFAATSPRTGIYNVAYDLWLNGVGWGNGTTEFMIWTDNYKQVPLGSKVETKTFSGYPFDVYRYTSSSDGGVHVISFVSPTPLLSGSLNLKEMLDWFVGKGWLTTGATVNQIGYGVEICSTNNQPATFYFNDFSVTMK